MNPIYLDYAAATPLDESVLAAMRPYFSERFYNPSAVYATGRAVRADVEAARRTVALCLGVKPPEIVFTAGGTEANNLAIHGVMDRLLPHFPGARMLASAIEHDSVLETAKRYAHSLVPVTKQGIVDTAALQTMIDDDTALVSIMYANNEIGTVQPLREIGQTIDAIRKDRRGRGAKLPLYFHTDAAQAVNYLDLQAARLGVDLVSVNGGKIYGPKQSGVLYVRAGVELQPLLLGGGQERNVRSGTENVPAIMGLGRAMQTAGDMRPEEVRRLRELQKYYFSELLRLIPHAVINGSTKKRLPNNLHFTIPGQDNERLLFQLDSAGIQAAAGSACSAASQEASHVLRAIGCSEGDARASLRLSMGRATTKADLDRTLSVLKDIIT